MEIQIKYEGYIEKSLQQVEKLKKMENKKIPDRIDYDAIKGIATEARQKLKAFLLQTGCKLLNVHAVTLSIPQPWQSVPALNKRAVWKYQQD